MKIIISIVLAFTSSLLFSQPKNEYEKRISNEQFPTAAIQFLAPKLLEAKRIRFYKEFDGEQESFECKFKHDGKYFSVEFNRAGHLEDVEMRVFKNELGETVLQNVSGYLHSSYDRWKIEKVQRQYKATDNPEKTLQDALHYQNISSSYLELIVATKTEGKLERFEMLFNASGSFIKKRKIVRRSYDFLLF